MEQGGRIYFGEVLTANNQRLFINAMKFKKENKLAKVYTKNGLVTVKKSLDSRPTTIRSSRELDVFVESNQFSSALPTPGALAIPSAQQNHNATTTPANSTNNSIPMDASI